MADRYGQINLPREETPETPQNTGFTFDEFTYNDHNGIAFHNDPTSDNVFSRWFAPSIAEDAQFQRENYMVDKANAFNEYMYEKALQDNSPAAQMQRAKEAGINLNLAAAGIMGGGNAVATPMQGAQGSTGMNTNSESPIDMFGKAAQGINQLTQGTNTLGELLGFGKKNKAEIRQLDTMADKAAEEADFTYWQKRQFRRTMRILYDQAEQNLKETKARIEEIRKHIELFNVEKWKAAAETNEITAQTGETIQKAKTEFYNTEKAKFEDEFRKLFGVQLTENGLSMLIQAVLNGKGDIIINTLSDGLSKIFTAAKDNIEDNILDWINPLGKNGKKVAETIASRAFQSAPKEIQNTILQKIGVPIAAIKILLGTN